MNVNYLLFCQCPAIFRGLCENQSFCFVSYYFFSWACEFGLLLTQYILLQIVSCGCFFLLCSVYCNEHFFKIKFAGSTASRVKWGCATRQCSFNYISFLKNPIILLSFTSVLSALLYAVKNSIKTISFEMTQSVGKLLCEQWEPALCPLHPSSASSPGIFLWLPGKEQYWRELSWCCWGDGVFLLPGLSVITK